MRNNHLMRFAREGRARIVALAMMLYFFAPAAMAQAATNCTASGGGLGGIFRRLTCSANDGIWLMQVVGIFAGVGFIIGGVFALVKDARSQGNGPVGKGAAFTMIFCGALLAFASSLIDTAGDTVWGDGGGDRGRIEIPQ